MDATTIAWTPRVEWSELPDHVQAGISDMLGSPVVTATNQHGGFSPGLAARVRCADGSRAFVKAVGPELNEHSPGLYRREAAKAGPLPSTIPAPALRHSYDDGTWVALVFDEVEGSPPAMPWARSALIRVVDAIEGLGLAGTPNPVPGLPTASTTLHTDLTAYVRLAADPPPDLDEWERRHLEQLAECSADALHDIDGDTLAHLDLRADNMLIGSDDQVYFVDWPWAAAAAPWVDTVAFLVSAALHGHDPEPYLERSSLTCAANPKHVTGFLAGLAGMWAEASRRPAPVSLPTLRDFQRAQHDVTLEWLRRRTGWE